MTRNIADRPHYWTLAGKLAVPCKDAMEWARWFETAERIVTQTRIGGVEVSTVFLGLDHNFFWGEGEEPHIFETMIFRGGKGDVYARCGSWEKAVDQHAAAVAKVRAEIKDKVNE